MRLGVVKTLTVLLFFPLRWISLGVFRFTLLPGYRQYSKIKNRVKSNSHFREIESFQHFMQRYALYVGLIVLGILGIGNNLLAKTIRPDEVGQNAIWPVFTVSETSDSIVETATSKPTPVAASRIVAIGGTASLPTNTDATDQGGVSQPDAVGGVDSIGAAGGGGGPLATGKPVDSYTVQPGDTVSTIASRFGVSDQTVLQANSLGATDFIKPGQVLKIPSTNGVVYTVKNGDTLAAIASKYKGKTEEILVANQLASADAIQPGQDLVIPGGELPAPPAPPPQPTNRRGLLAQIFTPDQAPPPSNASGHFIWPTANHKINQYFRGRIHTGIDIEGDYSSPIYAAASGTVVYAAYDRSGYGLHIIISHGDGYDTLYGHASKIFVGVGDHVKQGQTIAMVGSTGRSTGTHLHFEIRAGEGFLNPLSLL
ncbi:MAG: peptidoglycan DD-metalloendopeptidase family protein [Candidatus Kerfeldbacteria bacterium]|nr:peptidoglycan DD-metalloendopeptidase family protein [Candidatus Kerfeldbacteria bacterium]